MKKHIFTAAVAAMFFLTALPVGAQNVAVVNGTPIPKSRLDTLEAQLKLEADRRGMPIPADIQKQLPEELINREVFAQEAQRLGMSSTDQYRNQMELMRQVLLSNLLFERFIKEHPVSDTEAKAQYDKVSLRLAQQPPAQEFKTDHILVDTEAQANDVLAQLKKGAKFADLAKKLSKDPGSAGQGGNLNWVSPKTMVPEFANALTKMKKGETSAVPVKTQYGYHIIHVSDIRQVKSQPLPPFDSIKAQIIDQLQQEKLAAYQKDLRQKAKVN